MMRPVRGIELIAGLAAGIAVLLALAYLLFAPLSALDIMSTRGQSVTIYRSYYATGLDANFWAYTWFAAIAALLTTGGALLHTLRGSPVFAWALRLGSSLITIAFLLAVFGAITLPSSHNFSGYLVPGTILALIALVASFV